MAEWKDGGKEDEEVEEGEGEGGGEGGNGGVSEYVYAH